MTEVKIEDFTCHNLCYQQWVDMYNKKDKECFDLQLKLSKIEELCKELMSENEEYISINQVLQIIRGKE